MLSISLPPQYFFFTYHNSQDFFFRQVSLAGIFFLGIVTPTEVISNGSSLMHELSEIRQG